MLRFKQGVVFLELIFHEMKLKEHMILLFFRFHLNGIQTI